MVLPQLAANPGNHQLHRVLVHAVSFRNSRTEGDVMTNPTNEQYGEIWKTIQDARSAIDSGSLYMYRCGRAAYEAVRPLVLAEAKRDIAAYLLDVHGWDVSDAIYAGQKVFDRLTAPPVDPAEVAVQEVVETRVKNLFDKTDLRKIVAAVRAADAKVRP